MIVPKMAICHPNNIGSLSSEFCPANFSLLKDIEYKWRFLPEPVFPRVLQSEVLTGLETDWKGKEREGKF